MPLSLEEIHSARETHDEILAALNELSLVNRQAVIGFYLQGYSYAELAQLLGVSVGTVKGRLFQGRQQLKTVLQPLAPTTIRQITHQQRKDAPMDYYSRIGQIRDRDPPYFAAYTTTLRDLARSHQ